ncbi:MAG: EcoRI family type II restriction endonuclease [Mariprofundales bacterium]
MANKEILSANRTGTIINTTSKEQEKSIIQAITQVIDKLLHKYPSIHLQHKKSWYLHDIISHLQKHFPNVYFSSHFKTSNIRPDGGILFLLDNQGGKYPILISEVKNQGTNDLRQKAGKPKQAKGNAIERLGKNVIGLRTALRNESIFPFICFGYGCDFEHDSYILDRISTIALFGKLCHTYLHDQGTNGYFDRGSYYFRAKEWSIEEMQIVMFDIAERSIFYYYSKYGKNMFSFPIPPTLQQGQQE